MLQSESFYDAQVNASGLNPGANTIFGQYYAGHLFGSDNRVVVTPFKLPYVAPGQTITGATVSWNYAGKKGTPLTSVDMYGLTRISTNPAPIAGDYYVGANDTANTRIQQGLIAPATAAGTVTCIVPALVTWLNAQYAAFAAVPTSDLVDRYVFLRMNGNAIEMGDNTNYLISTPDNLRPLIPTLTLTVSGTPTATPGRLQFIFETATAEITSSGVYSGAGNLVRTLWNNVPASIGLNTGVWDGNDDFGTALPAGTYTIKVMTNNVTYTWDGALGNTSTAQTGTSVYRSQGPIMAMDISGTNAFFALGYNELQCVFNKFVVGAPQVRTNVYPGVQDPFSNFALVAADATNSYWAKVAGGTNPAFTYVIGISNTTNLPVTFSSGSTIPATPGQQKYSSAIDLDTSSSGGNTQPNPASGLAVQKSGTFLFVAHSNLNVVRVFNKTTGASVNTIAITAPGLCATDAAGVLYVLSGTSLLKYTVDGGGNGTLVRTISGFTAPVGVGCDPTTNTVVVADNGILKAFNTSTGAALWTYGSTQIIPAITNSTFLFGSRNFIAYQPDGTFWVGDQGNQRYLHFSISGTTVTFIEQIAYATKLYSGTVDPNAITGAFNGYFEYTLNYLNAPGGTNGSWSLVNNWAVGLPSDGSHNYTLNVFVGLNNVVTFTNGRRYALINNAATGNRDLFDLTNGTTAARNTGINFPNNANQNYRIYADGSLRYTSGVGSGTVTYSKRALTGFDGSNNPQWSTSVSLCSFPQGSTDTHPDTNGFGVRIEQTASNLYPVFGAAWNAANRYHFGLVPPGGSAWVGQGSLNAAGDRTYTGRLPRNGQFDSGNGVNYAGNVLTVSGRNCFLGYHGEFWKNGQAATIYHWYDNGLMIGSFGTLSLFQNGNTNQANAGYAGNNYAQTCITDQSGNVYIFTTDESQHGGLNRFSVHNLGSVAEISAPGALGSVITILAPTPPIPPIPPTPPTPAKPPSSTLDVCLTSALNFVECPTGHSKLTGTVLSAGTFDFSGAITSPYWALGFSSLGNAFPFQTNIEQAFFFTNLQVYPSDLPQLSATQVQFFDQYQTPSGQVQTKWTVTFDHANKKITIGDLMAKLPDQTNFRATNQILLSFWKLDSFSYAVPPAVIFLPYA